MSSTTSTNITMPDFLTSYNTYNALRSYTSGIQSNYISTLMNGNTSSLFAPYAGSAVANSPLSGMNTTSGTYHVSDYIQSILGKISALTSTTSTEQKNTIDVEASRIDSLYQGLQKAWNGEHSNLSSDTNIANGDADGWWVDLNLDGEFTEVDRTLAFDLGLDSDKDGNLLESEVGKAITGLADTDKDSKMSREEYVNWLAEINEATISEITEKPAGENADEGTEDEGVTE